MSVGAEELRDLPRSYESKIESRRAIIRLLAYIEEWLSGGTTIVSNTSLTLTNGTGAIPAGRRSVNILATANGVTVEGRTLNLGDQLELKVIAPNQTLPAITPSGGSWQWIALG